MSWLDDIFGSSALPQGAAPAAPSGPAALQPVGNPDPRVAPSYADFFKGLAAATQSRGYFGNIGQHGLIGAIGQTDRDMAALPTAAPDAYLKLLQAQNGVQATNLANQTGNMDVAQTAEALRRSGIAVPDYLNGAGNAGTPPQGQAVAGFPITAAQGQQPPPSPPTAPQMIPSGAVAPTQPVPPPALVGQPPAPAAGSNPIDAQRQRFSQLAQLYTGLPKYLQAAQEYMKLQQIGAIPGTAVRGDTGQLADAASGAPVGDTRTWQAQGAGMTSGAQAQAQVGPHNAEAAFKGGVDKDVNAARIEAEARNRFQQVTTPDGMKSPISDWNLAHGGAPTGQTTGFADNPYRPAQIKQVEDAQSAGSIAASQQAAVQQLGGALDQFGGHGPLGQRGLDILRGLDQVGLLSPELKQKVAAGELANMSSVEVAGALAKQIGSGRVPLGLFNQVSKSKPSILLSEPKLALEAINQDLQRARDFGDFAPTYYSDHANATKLDAQSAFDKAKPLSLYQSRVMPLPVPAKDKLQADHTYKLKDGRLGVWTGSGFTVQ